LECWSHLEQVVQEGRPHRHLSDLIAGQEAAFAREYIRGMLPISTQPAQAIAEIFRKRPLRRILDVGCGPGAYALALLDNHPEATATLFDLPDALPVTRELVAAHPHAGRLRYEPGDYRHDESPETVQGMFAKAFAALRPGGMLAVHDWVAASDAVDREWSAFFSLHMLVYTDGGRTYALDEYRTMLEAVGFTGFRTESIQAGSVRNPTTLVMADRAVRA